MPDTTVPAPAGPLAGYLAAPTGEGPWPGVVVVHDVFGMTADLRRQVDWLASEGFLAVAPDLRRGRAGLGCTVALFRELRARRGRSFEDLEATRRWLAADERCTGRVGVVGFCMGGGFALLLAGGDAFAAASVNYGDVPADATEILAGACPIVGSFGGRDRMLRHAPARLVAALEANGVPHDVVVYPEAGHGFLNDHRTPVAGAVVRLSGGGFHGPSAEDARRRIVAFLTTHLSGGPPATDR
jgi:carboxymethylenebutenolidase